MLAVALGWGTADRLASYKLLRAAGGSGERLGMERTTLGLSQKCAAQRIGVDPSRLARWESGEKEPAGAALGRVEQLLRSGAPAMRRIG